MADWYISSAAYSGISAFVASHAYSIGDFVVPTSPTARNKFVFRCTTAGTSSTEPSWTGAGFDGSTITSGGATFTNVTGRSAYFWSAAAGDLATLLNWTTGRNVTDRFFISSDHSETQSSSIFYGGIFGTSFGTTQYLCVNRAGSTPPVAADLATGATISVGSGNNLLIENFSNSYHYGITYAQTGTNHIIAGNSGTKSIYLSNCQLYLNTSTTSSRIQPATAATLILDNSTVRFGSTSQSIGGNIGPVPFDVYWFNTPSAIAGATIPTILFQPLSIPLLVTCRGVDLSAITSNLYQNGSSSSYGGKVLLDSCKIASGVTRYSSTNVANTRDAVELVNCYDGTNILSERYQSAGSVTTEFTITLSSGATDNVGTFSHKMVTGSNVDKFVQPLEGFWMDLNYTTTGSSKTATVEIISSTTLNNDEIALYLQYEGTSSSSVASFANSLPTTVLTSASAVTSSTASWNAQPGSPVKQKLQVTFTPQQAGRLRGQVRLGKASTTVYYNPKITVT
jgi:hypothetical protein